MAEEKPMIEALGYIGGQDEELGGYCEPLIIRVNGEEHYVLHEMHTYYEQIKIPDYPYSRSGDIKAKHSKVEFGRLEELTSEFDKVKARLGIDSSLLGLKPIQIVVMTFLKKHGKKLILIAPNPKILNFELSNENFTLCQPYGTLHSPHFVRRRI